MVTTTLLTSLILSQFGFKISYLFFQIWISLSFVHLHPGRCPISVIFIWFIGWSISSHYVSFLHIQLCCSHLLSILEVTTMNLKMHTRKAVFFIAVCLYSHTKHVLYLLFGYGLFALLVFYFIKMEQYLFLF